MSEKRPYNNQVNHYCQKCKRWTLHTRGRKYYSCLTCCTKEERGLTQLAPDAGDSAAPSGIVNASAESTSQAESAPTQRG